MAETKQGGGFHAFEQRVHQMEEEHEREEKKGAGMAAPAAKRESAASEKGARKEPEK